MSASQSHMIIDKGREAPYGYKSALIAGCSRRSSQYSNRKQASHEPSSDIDYRASCISMLSLTSERGMACKEIKMFHRGYRHYRTKVEEHDTGT